MEHFTFEVVKDERTVVGTSDRSIVEEIAREGELSPDARVFETRTRQPDRPAEVTFRRLRDYLPQGR